MKRILILCTGNSCRSQMAMGYLQTFDKNMVVCSAGTKPAEAVNPYAVAAMAEDGIDLSAAFPKSVNEYLDDKWDYVITVCGGAKETCPMFVGEVGKQVHIGFDDPAAAVGTQEEIMGVFRRVRNEIKHSMQQFYLEHVKGLKMPVCECCG